MGKKLEIDITSCKECPHCQIKILAEGAAFVCRHPEILDYRSIILLEDIVEWPPCPAWCPLPDDLILPRMIPLPLKDMEMRNENH